MACVCVCVYSVLTCKFMFVGTKNVGKEMKKVASGLVKNRGKTWFPQLVDKRKKVYIFVDLLYTNNFCY